MFEWIKIFFSKFLKIFKVFVADAFSIASKIIIAEFKDVAISVVKDLTIKDLTNEEKRKQAFDALKRAMLDKGKSVGDSLIYALIELALQYVKEQASREG